MELICECGLLLVSMVIRGISHITNQYFFLFPAGFFGLIRSPPTHLEIPELSASRLPLKCLALETLLPLRISNDLPWGVWIFLCKTTQFTASNLLMLEKLKVFVWQETMLIAHSSEMMIGLQTHPFLD